MPTYTYRARDKQGGMFTATLEAESDLAVATNLRSLGYTVISVEESSAAEIESAWSDFWQKIKKVQQSEIIFFSRQLSSLFKSGISITAALNSIAEQTRNKILKGVINSVLKDIQSGASFSQSLAKHPDIFSDLFVSMVRVGETAGILDEVLERISQLYTQEMELKSRLKSAMIYPVILVVVATVIVGFLLIKIIPQFAVIFDIYEAKLPLSTQLLLGLSFLVRKLWIPAILATIGSIVWFKKYIKTEKGRYRFHFHLLRLPLFGQLYLKVIVSRFSRTLGALLRSGVPMLEALYVTEKTVGNSVISRIIENVRVAITEGQSLTDPLKTSGAFPSTVVQMVSAGEKSGKLDQMFIDIASFYDREVDYTIRNIVSSLEPLLLLAMGSLVAFIALSVLLPIFNLIKVFRPSVIH